MIYEIYDFYNKYERKFKKEKSHIKKTDTKVPVLSSF